MADKVGLVQIYTGDGKGKTTAALGQAVRAAGRGFNCVIIQFMKGKTKGGEATTLSAIPNIAIERLGRSFIGVDPSDSETVKESLLPAMSAARAAVGGEYDLVILDEAVTAASLGVIDIDELLRIVQSRKASVEVILTGRGADQRLIDAADLVTEMKLIKHPFDQGRKARAGIEF